MNNSTAKSSNLNIKQDMTTTSDIDQCGVSQIILDNIWCVSLGVSMKKKKIPVY